MKKIWLIRNGRGICDDFLDANAFYSYIGRRNLGLIESTHVNEAKLSKYLDSIREKSLPASVFIEIMAHFRDDSSRFSEYEDLKFQIGSSRDGEHGGRRKLPYVYTEQGIAMLSAVLRSDIAIQVSIQIMKTFVELRRYLAHGAFLLEKVNDLEIKQIESDKKRDDFEQKTNKRLEEVFDYIDAHEESNQKIFFDGQILF